MKLYYHVDAWGYISQTPYQLDCNLLSEGSYLWVNGTNEEEAVDAAGDIWIDHVWPSLEKRVNTILSAYSEMGELTPRKYYHLGAFGRIVETDHKLDEDNADLCFAGDLQVLNLASREDAEYVREISRSSF